MNTQYTNRLDKIEEEIKKNLPVECDIEWLKTATGCSNPHISTISANNINKPCIELLYRGGKRWRPLIMLLTAESLNNKVELALKLSPLVELIHNGTLLIDDIEDKAIERRGKPAVHLIYGDDMAINSGNHLYYIATSIIEQLNIDASLKLKIYESINQNMRRLHFGQGLDIQWHKDLNKIPTIDEYMQMCKFKTGCLASMAAELGAIIGGLNYKLVEEYREIWEEIGVGFQIMDDIKNITTGNPGKHRGDDIVEGKKSLPVILYSNNNDSKLLLKHMSKAKRKGIIKGKKYIEQAIKILETDNSINKSLEIATNLINKSLEKLKCILPENDTRELLTGLIISFLK